MNKNKVRKKRRIEQIYELLIDDPFLTPVELGELLGCTPNAVSSNLVRNHGTSLTNLRREVFHKYWQPKEREAA